MAHVPRTTVAARMTEATCDPEGRSQRGIPHMFTVTRAAAKQIRRTAAAGDTEELALRIAASRTGDGGIDYRMGFDDAGVDDTLLSTNGVDVVIAAADKALLNGTVLDHVEIEPGEYRFIFLNPNDPHYRPPTE